MGYEVIKDLAKQKGISLESIANQAGITYNSLSKIVRNTIKTPKYSTIKQIADALDMTIDELSYAIGMTDIPPDKLISPINITDSEHEIVKYYRNLDNYGKELVQLILRKELERCNKQSI